MSRAVKVWRRLRGGLSRTRLTEQTIEILVRELSRGSSLAGACGLAGIHPSTTRAALARGSEEVSDSAGEDGWVPSLDAQLFIAVGFAEGWFEKENQRTVNAAIRGDGDVARGKLGLQANIARLPDQWGPVKARQGESEGPPVNFRIDELRLVVHQLSDQDLLGMADRLMQRDAETVTVQALPSPDQGG